MQYYSSDLKIKDIVAENYQYASVLHFFGIQLYNYSEASLGAICARKGLSIEQVISKLQGVTTGRATKIDYQLRELPLDVVIDYLKSAHRSFVRHKLPYMADLIAHIDNAYFDAPSIAEDLKFIFPIFMEDFIHHIYEEEKEHFGYIERLKYAVEKKFRSDALFRDLSKHSIEKIMAEHAEEDDEMAGIRDLTNGYAIAPSTNLYTKVIYSELLAFERDLKVHAYIEDEILFPKALELEKKACDLLRRRALMN